MWVHPGVGVNFYEADKCRNRQKKNRLWVSPPKAQRTLLANILHVTGQLSRTLIARRAMYIKPLFWQALEQSMVIPID